MPAAQPSEFPFVIGSNCKPGIQRDGTLRAGDAYVDGQWTRWQRGFARKMGGYRQLTNKLTGIQRGLHETVQGDFTYFHVGAQSSLERLTVDNNTGVVSGVSDRTPAGLATNSNYVWQFDSMYDGGGSAMLVFAHPGQNLTNLGSSATSSLYSGNMYGTAALTAVTASAVSGGVLVTEPYLWVFGDDGYINWSVPNTPTDLTGVGSGNARITGKKLVRGVPLKAGGGNTPAALFFSLDSVIRASFVGGSAIFDFDTLATTSSLLSSRCVVEYDGIYFWAANNRFMMYNGVVREVPNQRNLNYFFDNIRSSQQGRCYGYAIPRWGEIWWCFPLGDSTECNHAVILNVRENEWYDTPLPALMRSSGEFNHVYTYPVMTDATADSNGKTSLWQHEIGVDEVTLTGQTNAVRAFFTTGDVSGLDLNPPGLQSLAVGVVEPDFIQSGAMTMTVSGRANSRAGLETGDPVAFDALATTIEEQVVYAKTQRRLLQFTFESNVAGGDFEAGRSVAHLRVADDRIFGKLATEAEEGA